MEFTYHVEQERELRTETPAPAFLEMFEEMIRLTNGCERFTPVGKRVVTDCIQACRYQLMEYAVSDAEANASAHHDTVLEPETEPNPDGYGEGRYSLKFGGDLKYRGTYEECVARTAGVDLDASDVWIEDGCTGRYVSFLQPTA